MVGKGKVLETSIGDMHQWNFESDTIELLEEGKYSSSNKLKSLSLCPIFEIPMFFKIVSVRGVDE